MLLATEGSVGSRWTKMELTEDIAADLAAEPDIANILHLGDFTLETYIQSAIMEHLLRVGATCQEK